MTQLFFQRKNVSQYINLMKISLQGILFFFILLLIIPSSGYAEGTKQILLSDAGFGKIQVMSSFTDFAWYDNGGSAAPDYRLYIHVANANEKIYYGFGDPVNSMFNVANNVYYRIKNPAGVIVAGPTLVPTAGAGHISTFNQAVAGPTAIAGGTGYNAFLLQPLTTGDYFIEFNFPLGGGNGTDRIAFKYFDITVSTTANAAIDGRVWSKAWQFTTDDFGNPFYGKIFVYTDDGIVTSMNFNGMEPYVFTVSCNEFGCFNTGNFLLDRRSVTGNHQLPQYKTFLNDPDILVYPTGTPGTIVPPVLINASCDGTAKFDVNVTKAGSIAVVVNINPLPGIQPEDLQFSLPVVAGVNTINWNGLNGLGQPLANGTPIEVMVSYLNGLTNLPIYDVEAMTNGFIVQLVRPAGSDPNTYWDDQLIPGGGQQLLGCTFVPPTTGCHPWTGGSNSGIGNNNTINTWWYVVTTSVAPVTFLVRRTPNPPGPITGTNPFCSGVTLTYSVPPEPNSTSYVWAYSGTGATITNNGNNVISITFSIAATSGVLSVRGFNNECGLSAPTNLALTVYPNAVVLNPLAPVCVNVSPYLLSGGIPVGGTFTGPGITANTFNPATAGVGNHLITYTATSINGCISSDQQILRVDPVPNNINGIYHQ